MRKPEVLKLLTESCVLGLTTVLHYDGVVSGRVSVFTVMTFNVL